MQCDEDPPDDWNPEDIDEVDFTTYEDNYTGIVDWDII